MATQDSFHESQDKITTSMSIFLLGRKQKPLREMLKLRELEGDPICDRLQEGFFARCSRCATVKRIKQIERLIIQIKYSQNQMNVSNIDGNKDKSNDIEIKMSQP